MEAQVFDQLRTLAVLTDTEGLDYREKYHSFALTQSED